MCHSVGGTEMTSRIIDAAASRQNRCPMAMRGVFNSPDQPWHLGTGRKLPLLELSGLNHRAGPFGPVLFANLPSGQFLEEARVGDGALPASARPAGGQFDAELGPVARDGPGAQFHQGEPRPPHVRLAGPDEPRGGQGVGGLDAVIAVAGKHRGAVLHAKLRWERHVIAKQPVQILVCSPIED